VVRRHLLARAEDGFPGGQRAALPSLAADRRGAGAVGVLHVLGAAVQCLAHLPEALRGAGHRLGDRGGRHRVGGGHGERDGGVEAPVDAVELGEDLVGLLQDRDDPALDLGAEAANEVAIEDPVAHSMPAFRLAVSAARATSSMIAAPARPARSPSSGAPSMASAASSQRPSVARSAERARSSSRAFARSAVSVSPMPSMPRRRAALPRRTSAMTRSVLVTTAMSPASVAASAVSGSGGSWSRGAAARRMV